MAEKNPIKIIIADDHELIRIGLKIALQHFSQFSVIAEAENGRELLDILEKYPTDIILLDIDMPVMDGIEALKVVKHRYPHIRVVMLSMYKEREPFTKTQNMGADGFICKTDPPAKIASMLSELKSGQKVFSNIYKSFLNDQGTPLLTPIDSLTKREKEIYYLIIRGYSNSDIAESLQISLATVEFHKKNIKEKLEAENTADLIHIAYRYKVI